MCALSNPPTAPSSSHIFPLNWFSFYRNLLLIFCLFAKIKRSSQLCSGRAEKKFFYYFYETLYPVILKNNMSNNSNSSSIKMWHFYTRQTYQIGILKKIPCCIHCSCLFGFILAWLQLGIFVCTLLCKKTVILSISKRDIIWEYWRNLIWGKFYLIHCHKSCKTSNKPLLCQKVFTIQSQIYLFLLMHILFDKKILFLFFHHCASFLNIDTIL
jgi:hypothetical protein